MKKVLLLGLLVLVVGVSSVKAVDSYELFWPMVAGKTMSDGFVYKLKILKEDVRGYLIFGPAPKADYRVFLGVKRLLEAEKLLREDNKKLLSLVTLDKSISEFEGARIAYTLDSKNRLENVVSLATNMGKQYSFDLEIKSKLEQIVSKVNVLLSKFSQ